MYRAGGSRQKSKITLKIRGQRFRQKSSWGLWSRHEDGRTSPTASCVHQHRYNKQQIFPIKIRGRSKEHETRWALKGTDPKTRGHRQSNTVEYGHKVAISHQIPINTVQPIVRFLVLFLPRKVSVSRRRRRRQVQTPLIVIPWFLLFHRDIMPLLTHSLNHSQIPKTQNRFQYINTSKIHKNL